MTLLRRRATRERVLQTLYAYELSQEPIASVLENVLGDFHSDRQSLEFAKQLIQEVIGHQPEIERLIKAKVSHWEYNRIAVIDKGQTVALGTPEDLKSNVSDLSVVELEVFGIDAGTVERLRALDFVDSIVVEQRELRQVLRIQTRIAERAVAPLIAAVAAGQVGRVAVREATLEDAYVRLVGRVE